MLIATDLLIFFGMVAVTAALVSLMHWLAAYVDSYVPPYRRKLEATYASFHRFLLAIRTAAIRSRA